jgi:excisionase family DNA binding protein
MTDATLAKDVQELERSLMGTEGRVNVSLSRKTVEFITKVVKAKAEGQDIIVTHGHDEVTTTEAAHILGVSRPQVYKLLDKGLVSFRTVGTHRRIPAAELRAWQTAEKARREAALDRLAELQNEFGLVLRNI